MDFFRFVIPIAFQYGYYQPPDRYTADQSDTESRKGIFSIGYIKVTIFSNYTKLSVLVNSVNYFYL